MGQGKFLKNVARTFSKQLFLCKLTVLNAFRCVNAVSWSPDGKSLASASNDNAVRIWDAQTGQVQCTNWTSPVVTLIGHWHSVFGVCFSPDGSKLGSCSRDCSVKIWNPVTRECVSTLTGHSDW
jgi:WD40 repeat protein